MDSTSHTSTTFWDWAQWEHILKAHKTLCLRTHQVLLFVGFVYSTENDQQLHSPWQPLCTLNSNILSNVGLKTSDHIQHIHYCFIITTPAQTLTVTVCLLHKPLHRKQNKGGWYKEPHIKEKVGAVWKTQIEQKKKQEKMHLRRFSFTCRETEPKTCTTMYIHYFTFQTCIPKTAGMSEV